MKIKLLLLLPIAFLIGVMQLQAQDEILFHTIIENGYYNEPYCVEETGNGEYICNVKMFDPFSAEDRGTRFYKFNNSGNLIDSIFFEEPRGSFNKNQNEPYVFYSFNRFARNDSVILNTVRFDENFNILSEIDVVIPDLKIMEYGKCYVDKNDDIILIMAGRNSEEDKEHYLYAIIGNDGVIKQYRHDYSLSVIYPATWSDIFVYQDSPIEYGWCREGEIRKIDSSLNVTYLNRISYDLHPDYNYSGGGSNQACVKRLSDDRFVYTDQYSAFYSYYPFTITNGTINMLLDKSMNVLKYDTIGDDEDSYGHDLVNRICTRNPIVVSNDKSIYQVSSTRWEFPMQLPSPANQLIVTKYDENLNRVWQRYCCDPEMFTDPWCLLATEDGGCVIFGCTRSSTQTENGKNCPFVMKINHTVGITEMTEIWRPFCIYPNPSKDYVNIKISPDVRCEKAELYDIAGRLLKTYGSTSGTSIQFDVQDLPAGNYILNITLDNGKSYSEKVVITE